MVRYARNTLIAALGFGLIAMIVIAPGVSLAAPEKAAPSPALTRDDFLLSVAYRAPYMSGYLVREDNTLFYALASYSGWFWSDNYVMLISRNGFEGNVNLEVLDLPAGVTSEMPTTVFVPKFGNTIVSIKLRAATDAPLANANVTLRGTTANTIKTGNVEFEIVDQLPPLPS